MSLMSLSNSQLEAEDDNTEVVNVTYQQLTTADNSGTQNNTSVSDMEEYSYAYQHPSQQSEGMDKGSKYYQQLRMGDYMHMYSKPSPLLVRDTSRANAPSVEEREGEQ